MAIYINSPAWFQGIDSSIEFLSIIVAFLVAAYGYKTYRLCGEKKFKYFSSAFLLIGISFIFKILSELAIYQSYVIQQAMGPFIISRTVLAPVTWVHLYSHTIFRLLSLFAFFILLIVMLDIKNKPTLILITYFLIMVTFVSVYAHILFYITQILLIGILMFHFYNNYTKHKRCLHALFVVLAFLGIFVSNIVLTFMMYDPNIYAIGETIQLVGYGLLLYAFITVKRNDKQKKQA